MSEDPLQGGAGSAVEWGVATLTLEGENESGDLHFARLSEHGGLLCVVDGLGHGPEAAVAARATVGALERWSGGPLPDLFQRCHEAARRTRGAVLSVVSVDLRARAITWAGVGNIEGLLVRADPGDGPQTETIMLRGGVLGHQIPPVREAHVPISSGDVLMLATDGVHSAFREELDTHGTPLEVAHRVLDRHHRPTDDALVLVARFTFA